MPPILWIPVAFGACYFVVLLLVTPLQQAALMAVLAGVVLMCVSLLSRTKSPTRAFQWFRSHPLRGLFVVALTLSFPVIGVLNEIDWPHILVELPMVFLWFWMFAAIDTYIREPKA